MDYFGEIFGFVLVVFWFWVFFHILGKNNPKHTKPNQIPLPFLQFEIKYAWTPGHLPDGLHLLFGAGCATCSTLQLHNPVFIGTAACQGLNSAEQS